MANLPKVKSGDILSPQSWNSIIDKINTLELKIPINKGGSFGIGVETPSHKLHVNGDVRIDKWVRVKGDHGLFFQDYGGGFHMRDKSWIRTYGGKNFYHDKGIMRTDGELRVGANGDRFTVKINGKVGIGEANPTHQLHVKGDLRVEHWIRVNGDRGIYFHDFGGGFHMSDSTWIRTYGSKNFYHNKGIMRTDGELRVGPNGNRFIVKQNGKVGIGGNATAEAVLHVRGYKVNNAFSNYGFLNGKGKSGPIKGGAGNNVKVGIWSDQRIVCPEFMAKSDERIKTNITASSNERDLEILRKLEIVDYNLKDNLVHGNTPYKKVIGQQVAKVYPQAVKNNIAEFIPDIMQYTSITNGWVQLRSDTKIEVGEKIRLVFENEIEEVQIVEKGNNRQIKVNTEKQGNVLIYGRQVHDFHVVDYEALSMLNISATQELVKQMEAMKENMQKMKEAFILKKSLTMH